jgi:hypothetical protein
MKRIEMSWLVMFFVLVTAGITFAGAHYTPPGPMDPKGFGETVHMAYECDTFTPGKPNVHLPGADLKGPGDLYRYTMFRDDKYANDPNYEVVHAIVGVHIDDYDASKDGDKEPEWGKILINGEPMNYPIIFPPDKRKPGSSEFMEMFSDIEISPNPKHLMPPYIFNVTELAKENKFLVFEIMNLRKDGTIDGDAPFGDFVVNRIGYHVWYKKK